MRTIATFVVVGTILVLMSGCGGGGGAGGGGTAPIVSGVDAVTLAAGVAELEPDPTGHVVVDLNRLGAPGFARVYALETPAGADFAFSIVARSEGNVGGTQLFVA